MDSHISNIIPIKYLKPRYLIGFFLFFFSLFLYIFCLPHTPLGGDNADILTAIVARSNAHPSGYPSFVLLGILFSLLPLALPVVVKIGLLSALLSSLGVLLLYFLIYRQTSSIFISTVTVLTLSFIYPFWLYAESTDVFSFHYFLILILIFIAYIYRQTKVRSYLFLLSFLVGLSLTNNISIVLIFPTIFLLIYSKDLLRFLTLKNIAYLIFLFIGGLLPYLYLFYGSHNNSVYNWVNVDSISSFTQYVFRIKYGWGLSTQNQIDPVIRSLTIQSFFTYWKHNLPSVYFVVSLIGIVSMVRRDKQLALAYLTGIFFTGFFFLIYSGNSLGDPFLVGTLERFYMAPLLLTLPFFADGILFIRNNVLRFLAKNHTLRKSLLIPPLIQAIFLYIPLSLFFFNFPRANLQNIEVGELFTHDFLAPLPKNSILFFRSDTALFNAAYLQSAYGYRDDVFLGTTISADHLIQTKKMYSITAEAIRKEKPAIKHNDLLLATVFRLQNIKPVFSNEIIGVGIVDTKEWIPYGLVYRLKKPGEQTTKDTFINQQNDLFAKMSLKKVRMAINAENTPLLMLEIPSNYIKGFMRSGDYLISTYHDLRDAQSFYLRAHELDPSQQDPLRSVIATYILLGECENAVGYIHQLEDVNSDQAKVFQRAIQNPKICKKIHL